MATQITHTLTATTRSVARAVKLPKRQPVLNARTYFIPRTRPAFVAAEFVLLIAASLLAHRIEGTLGIALGMLLIMGFCGSLYLVGGFDRSILSSATWRVLERCLMTFGLGTGAMLTLRLLKPDLVPSPEIATVGVLAAALLPLALRPVLRRLVGARKLGATILIAGTGNLAQKLHRAMSNVQGRSAQAGPVNAEDAAEILAGPELHVGFEEVGGMIATQPISRVIVAEENFANRRRLSAALVDSRLRGVRVSDAVDFCERFSNKIWLEALDSQGLVFTTGFKRSRLAVLVKRASDLLFASVLLMLSAPLLVVIAIAVKLTSPGPILFRQVRVGLHGREFVMLKFRSMNQDAETKSGPVWSCQRDSRITGLGRILRAFRLDELPQLWNVLRGEMSLVGPRPERPFFVEQFANMPFFDLRHYVKPGITGWAQVKFPYGASREDAYEKLQYDFYYVKHGSLRCDLAILVRTIGVVLMGQGR